MKKIEKHLYENAHTGKDGVTTRRFYGKFTDWSRRPLTIALGDDLNAARIKLNRLHDLNRAKVCVELDEARELREELERQQKQKADARRGITFRDWAQKYFDEMVPPEKRASTVRQELSRIKSLNDFFGDVPLCDIDLDMILQYRKQRAAEVGLATCNLAVSFLRYLLNLAADHGVLDSVPRIKLRGEKDRKQQRSVELDEYRLIIASLKRREQQRCVIGWWETGTRHQELFDLKWSMVDFRAGLLRLPAEILKEREPRRTPISYELRVVLDELKAEQQKVGNITGHVFTRKNGQPILNINRALDFALRRAKLLDDKTPKARKITPHSFRRAFITRLTDCGIPRDVVMAVSGHAPSGVHDGYIRLTDQMLVDHFRTKGLLSTERKTAAVG